MKFASIARVIWVFGLQAIAFAQECPLYNTFLSGIEAGSINPNRMEMLAGLAGGRRNPAVLWAHNYGPINRVFALSTTSRSIDDFTFDRTLTEVEDIAVGPGAIPANHYIYIGDIGSLRSSVVIARFAEPLVNLEPHPSGNIPLVDQTYFTVKYPDGMHEARALMVDPISNDLFVITFEDLAARVYRITQEALVDPNGTMTFVSALGIPSVTAADISADGSQIAVRSISLAMRWIRLPGQTIAQALASTPHSIPLVDAYEISGESLAFAADGSGYYTTGQGQDPPLYFFARNTSAFTIGQAVATINNDSITEISGVAVSRRNPGSLWMHNDGRPYQTYLVSTDGSVKATFQFQQETDDYEDIAVGPGPVSGEHYVYAGDIGDNSSLRSSILIYRFVEPVVTQPLIDVTAAGETVIVMTYPDGAHDAEALMVDPITGDLFIVTKESNALRVYKATQAQLNSGQVVPLALVQSGNFGPVSGGDISPDGSQIVLRHENEARLWKRTPGESVETALGRAGQRIPVIGEPIEPNGEGIGFTADSRGYYTMSEGTSPTIYYFERLAQPSFTKPPEVTPNGVRVTVSGCEGSRIRLEGSNELVVWATVGSGFINAGTATINSAGGAPLRFYRAVVDGP